MLSGNNEKARVIFSVYYTVRLNNSYIIMATLKLSRINNTARRGGGGASHLYRGAEGAESANNHRIKNVVNFYLLFTFLSSFSQLQEYHMMDSS